MKTQAAIQAFLHNRRAKRLRPRTIQWYESNLTKFAHFCPELPTEPEPIEEFLIGIPGEPETLHGYYRSLRALFRFLCRRQRLMNPMDLIDPPRLEEKVRSTLRLREMWLLLNQAKTPREKAILALLIDNGIRATELAELRKENVLDDTILVRGKSGQREVPISEETRRLLLALISTDGTNDHVFMGQHGPLTRTGIYRIVRILMQKAGIRQPKLGPHRLRHGFGKNYIVNGGDLRSLQKILGHRKITTTQIYAELAIDEVVSKHRQFTPLRYTHAAAQGEFSTSEIVREAEAIVKGEEVNE